MYENDTRSNDSGVLIEFTGCHTGRFGVNCENVCLCAVNTTCDPVNGCSKCLTDGLTGGNCDIDNNECHNATLCGQHAKCVNLNGSYSCVCDTWFEMRNNFCEGNLYLFLYCFIFYLFNSSFFY